MVTSYWALVTVSGMALLLLLCLGGLILVKSSIAARTDQRTCEVHQSVREWFAARSASEDLDWQSAVENLSAVERRVLTGVLEEHLQNASKSDPPESWSLAAALDVKPDFETVPQQHHERLEALKWAILLDYHVDPRTLTTYIADNRNEREAAAQVLLASNATRARQTATDLLLRGRPLSIFGMDTLYRHYQSDASELLRVAIKRQGSLDTITLIQILSVSEKCGAPVNGLADWVTNCLSHESTGVRSAANRALVAWGAAMPHETPDAWSGEAIEVPDNTPASKVQYQANRYWVSAWSANSGTGFWTDLAITAGKKSE